MTVKELMEELSKVNPNFNVMISVGRKGERDLIEKVRTAECPNPSRFPDFGWVELISCNPIDWHYLTKECEKCGTEFMCGTAKYCPGCGKRIIDKEVERVVDAARHGVFLKEGE